ncbi:Nucleotide-sugar transporter [Cooperia oncophora]
METLKVCIPAFAYAIQNNLYYIALANIDATTYTVTYQLRILTTALLSVMMLGKEISRCQWGALSLSGFGVILVQVSFSIRVVLILILFGNNII